MIIWMAEILLKQIMQEKNIKVNRLVPFLSISRSTVYNILNGTTSPTIDQLEEIAIALDVPIEALYEINRCKKPKSVQDSGRALQTTDDVL